MLNSRLVIFYSLLLTLVSCSSENSEKSATKKRMLVENQSRYQGECPCPQSFDKKGGHCGDSSTYTKNGEKSPVCYESDITDEMVAEYIKQTHSFPHH